MLFFFKEWSYPNQPIGYRGYFQTESNVIPFIQFMRDLKEKSRSEFDWLSKYYDILFGTIFFRSFYRRLENEVDHLDGKNVLSIGSGTATLEIHLAEKFSDANIVCLDLSSKMHEVARKKSSHIKNISFVEGDVESLLFHDQNVDVIICSHSFHHYPDQKRLLKRCIAYLKSTELFFL